MGTPKNIWHGFFNLKLSFEFERFRNEMISKTPLEVFQSCYLIDQKVCIYELLVEMAGSLSDECLVRLCHVEEILDEVYTSWLADRSEGEDGLKQVLLAYIADKCKEAEIEAFRKEEP